MSLSDSDLYTLENWFSELKLYAKDTDQYYEVRNRIFTFVYKKLSDLLETRINLWRKKYFLSEEDSQSIFSDALLACVDKYQPKKSKFITYFWTACENLAKNYYKHHRRMRRIPPTSLVNVDFSSCLDDSKFTPEDSYAKTIIDHLRNLYDADAERQEYSETLEHALATLQGKLTKTEQSMLEKVIVGHSITQISKDLQIPLSKALTHMKNIRKKAQNITIK